MEYKYEYLLCISKHVTYETPCGQFEVLYSNSSFSGTIHWIIRDTRLSKPIVREKSLSDALIKLVSLYPHLDSPVYRYLTTGNPYQK